MKKLVSCLFMLVFMLNIASCRKSEQKDRHTISLVGSTSVEHVAGVLKEEFEKTDDVNIEIQALGSSAGITAVKDKTADLAMSSRDLTESEKESGLVPIKVAVDGIAIIVHPENPVSELTKDEIKKIYNGTIQNWSEVGGNDEEIIVISRESGSGTRDSFEDLLDLRDESGYSFVEDSKPLIADGNGSMRSNVSSKPRAIGYVSLEVIDEKVKTLEVDGVKPTPENILADKYTLYRSFLFITPQEVENEHVKKFLEYIESDEAKKAISDAGFIPVV